MIFENFQNPSRHISFRILQIDCSKLISIYLKNEILFTQTSRNAFALQA